MNNKRKYHVKLIAVILLLSAVIISGCGGKTDPPGEILTDMDGFFKERGGIKENEDITTASWYRPGDSLTDWIILTEAKAGFGFDREKYLKDLKKYVETAYAAEDKLDSIKATEWHRIALVVMATGGDPERFGKDKEGKPIDLIRDGTYGWTQTDEPDAQGSNALMYAIHVLKARGGNVPRDAKYTEADMVKRLLDYRAEDGGFSLAGSGSDIDITAMAVQALSYYKDDEKTYEIDGESLRIADVIEGAVDYLAECQTQGGYYAYTGRYSSETCSQVIMALSMAGIDPREDPRFEKAGGDPVDALLSFRNEDGGFASSLDTGGSPEESDMMATYQAGNALISLMLYDRGDKRFFESTDGVL